MVPPCKTNKPWQHEVSAHTKNKKKRQVIKDKTTWGKYLKISCEYATDEFTTQLRSYSCFLKYYQILQTNTFQNKVNSKCHQ